MPDNLAELGKLTKLADTNIIKLPNISASVPQLIAAIKELQGKGLRGPGLPAQPEDRRGQGDPRPLRQMPGQRGQPGAAAKATRTGARPRPSRSTRASTRTAWATWSQASRTHVATMRHGDFYHGEKSMTLDRARNVKMELETKGGETIVLKPKVSLRRGRRHRFSMFMSKKALIEFYEEQMQDAYETGVMFSLHVKATMMKVIAPHRLRPRREDLLQGRLRQAPGAVRRARRQRQQRIVRSLRQDRVAARVAARGDHPRPARRATSTGPSWPWSIRPRASPTSIRPAT